MTTGRLVQIVNILLQPTAYLNIEYPFYG